MSAQMQEFNQVFPNILSMSVLKLSTSVGDT